MLTTLIFVADAPAIAQSRFPGWMDEVQFKSNNNTSQAPAAPHGPIDPETGQISSLKNTAGSTFHKPILPDFSKLREKALKLKTEQKMNANGQLEESYSASLQNIEELRKQKNNLETLLSANPGEAERRLLLKETGELGQKISLTEELLTLLGNNLDQAGNTPAIASLTADQFNRVKQLQQVLFPQIIKQPAKSREIKAPAKAPQTTSVAFNEQEPSDEELRRARTYRPGRIKSFYREQQQMQHANEEEDEE